MATIGQDIQRAKYLLEKGELVAIPTETVYGLAGNALDASVVIKIFAAKDRPLFDPVIIHIPSLEAAKDYVGEIPSQANELANHFWPGPLTLLLTKREIIPDLVTAGLDRVGLRCPDHPLTRNLLAQLSFPLAAPSANPFGYVSPTTAQHVQDQLGDKVAYILDGGPCRIGIESTIIGWEAGQPTIYRLGGISQEQVESVIGKLNVNPYSTSQPQSPGQLKTHYAPAKKFLLGDIQILAAKYSSLRLGILSFQKEIEGKFHSNLVLSPSGDLKEAARNLFSMMRKFDEMNIDLVLAEELPDEGLGRAINDRLRRAAASNTE